MTSRERVTAAARGGSVDRRPLLAYPEPSEATDIIVAEDPEGLRASIDGEKVVLGAVDSPFRRCGTDLAKQLSEDPESAHMLLQKAVDDTRTDMSAVLSAGADGIFYRLFGAREGLSTPMEYGGHFLERDRELLEEVQDANLNVLFLVGNEGLYMDFVSDLPAHVIAWDVEATGISAADVRQLRNGAQASSDPASEIHLQHQGIRIADRIESF